MSILSGSVLQCFVKKVIVCAGELSNLYSCSAKDSLFTTADVESMNCTPGNKRSGVSVCTTVEDGDCKNTRLC